MRRDKLVAITKTLVKLTQHLDNLDPQTVADAMGRIAPTEWMDAEELAANGLPSGVRITRPTFSITPAVLHRYEEMRATMAQLKRGAEQLAQRQQGARRGAEETPDALMFALEGLAAIWLAAKGVPPVVLGKKRGSFGAFAHEALSLCGDEFSSSQITTGLRRLHEKTFTRI